MAGTLVMNYDAPHTYQRRLTTTDIDALLQASHHYLVTRGPSVRIVETYRYGPRAAVMALKWKGQVRHAAIEWPDPVEPTLTIRNQGAYWVLTSGHGELLLHGSAWAYAAFLEADDAQLPQHEVLYIGKAYGRPMPDGRTTRNAASRLAAHSKLQVIQEDHEGEDHDIFVTPLLVEQGLWSSDDFIDDDDLGPDPYQVLRYLGPEAERSRVALAEEALIAYFKPYYNEKLKQWSGTTAAASDMGRTGLRVLDVTVTAWQGLAKFWSAERRTPARAHQIRWVVGTDESSQPPYAVRPGDSILADASATAVAEVEASGRLFGIFGPALPRPAPWDATIPDE